MDVVLEKWAEWRATPEEPMPKLPFVPALARRRLTALQRVALAAAWRVWPGLGEIPVVFASRWGEIGVTYKLMKSHHDAGETSPAAFSVSVHNAAPGAFSLFTKNHAPYTAIAAGAASFDMGLLEAAAQCARTLFVYAEEATPDDYRADFPDLHAAPYALAMLLCGSKA